MVTRTFRERIDHTVDLLRTSQSITAFTGAGQPSRGYLISEAAAGYGKVEPASSILKEAHGTGARLIYVNRTPAPTDHLADVRFNENAGDVMSFIVEGIRA